MKFAPTILGIVIAAALLALLGLTRLMVSSVDPPEYEIREIETSILPDPPPPPPEDPPPEAPPPPPSLTDVSEVPDPQRVPIPKAEVPYDLEAPVDPFFTDVPPAPMPTPAKPTTRPSPEPSPRVSQPKPPKPTAKSHYSVSELDGKPQLLRHGSAVFPRSLASRGVSRGTVVLEVELDQRGNVTIRRVVSSTHSELIKSARRVAASARFTPPTRQGKPVKSIMRWPITIRK